MKRAFLKISAICATCAILSASAWAQSELQNNPSNDLNSNQTNRSWSTKHLSATGRENDQVVRASKLVGTQVKDSSGHPAGQIEDIIVNPVSGHIDFALLSLNTSSSNASSTASGKLVPVPWSLFRASGSSQYSGDSEQPAFTLKADQSKLSKAPAVDWSDLNQSEGRQRIYAYYGVTPQSSTGGAESPGGEIKGQGAVKGTTPQPQPQLTP